MLLKSLGYMQLITAQVGVGISVVMNKKLLQEGVSVSLLVEGRFIFSTLCLLINLLFMMAFSKNLEKDHVFVQLNQKQWLLVFAQSLCGGVLFNCLLSLGQQYTTATMAGILSSTLPAILAVLSVFFLNERLNNKKVTAIILTMFGVVILNLDTLGQDGDSKNILLGAFLVVLSMVPEALYTIIAKKLGPVINPLVQALAINIFSLLVFLPVCLYLGSFNNFLSFSSTVYCDFLWLGFSSYLFYYLWTAGVAKVQASVAAVFTGIMPLAATVGAVLIMGERFSAYDAAGMFLILVSVVIGSGVNFNLFSKKSSVTYDDDRGAENKEA